MPISKPCTPKSNSSIDVQLKTAKELKAYTSDNLSTEQHLLQMLDKKDFFRLETLLHEKRSELPLHIALYIDADLQNAFNQTEQSLQTIDKLLGNYGKSLNDTLLYRVFMVKYDNLYKQNRYSEAAEALKIAIDKYGHTADSVEVAKLREEDYNSLMWLKKIPPQKMHITEDITIPASLNGFNHIIVGVLNGGQSENFVFDTGASMNSVSESSSKRLGVRILEISATAKGVANKAVPFKFGIADTLWIGSVMFENVKFMVFPDESLSFPEANYVIHGIIGFPIINQMKEVVIRKNKSITVVAHPKKCNLHNTFLDGTRQIVQLEANGDTVLFFMDTGSIVSWFSGNYFAADSAEIRNKGTGNTMRRGSVDGFINFEVYDLTNVPLKIGGKELTVPTIAVLTTILPHFENYDGQLGQDVLMHFDTLILNYEDMCLSFDN